MKALDAPLLGQPAGGARRLTWLLLAGSVVGCCFLPASGADLASGQGSNPLPTSGSTLLALIRLLGGLAVVFAVLFGGVWLVRHWQRVVSHHSSAPRLRVLERQSLGQRHSLYVVGYDEQRVLIATSPAGVTMLTPLAPAELEDLPAPRNSPSPTRPAFLNVLWGAVARQS